MHDIADLEGRGIPGVGVASSSLIGAIAINTHEACTNQGFITCLPNARVPLFFL
jgi:type I restriction enzyme S subunit